MAAVLMFHGSWTMGRSKTLDALDRLKDKTLLVSAELIGNKAETSAGASFPSDSLTLFLRAVTLLESNPKSSWESALKLLKKCSEDAGEERVSDWVSLLLSQLLLLPGSNRTDDIAAHKVRESEAYKRLRMVGDGKGGTNSMWQIMILRGCVAANHGNVDDANERFRQALRLNGDCLAALYGSAHVLCSGGCWEEAHTLLMKIGNAIDQNAGNEDGDSVKESDRDTKRRRISKRMIWVRLPPDRFNQTPAPSQHMQVQGAGPCPVSPSRLLWLIARGAIEMKKWKFACTALQCLLDRRTGIGCLEGNCFFNKHEGPQPAQVERALAYALLQAGNYEKALKSIDEMSSARKGTDMDASGGDRMEDVDQPDPVMLLYKADASLCLDGNRTSIKNDSEKALDILQRKTIPPNKETTVPLQADRHNTEADLQRTGTESNSRSMLRCLAHNNVAVSLMRKDGKSSNALYGACRHLRAALFFEPQALEPAFNLTLVLWSMGENEKEAACKHWLDRRGYTTDKTLSEYVKLLGKVQETVKSSINNNNHSRNETSSLVNDFGIPSSKISALDVRVLSHWIHLKSV